MATCQLLYRLANECPIAWPAEPTYPIDKPAPLSSPVKRATSQSPVKSDALWLRNAYLNALYGAGEVEGRLLTFVKSLRKRREAVVDALSASMIPLADFDRKWRFDILKTLDSDASPLPEDARDRLKESLDAIAQPRDIDAGPAETPRELLKRLEIVEVKLQILLLVESTARRLQAPDMADVSSAASNALLEMYVDKLVIHQALAGMFGPSRGDTKANELDESQRFWVALEASYLPLLPSSDVERFRSKLFTGSALSALPSLASSSTSLPVPSPMHHPTPDLRRLAQAVSDAAAANAALRVPESPTLAKLIANPAINGTMPAPPRAFVRSRSTLNAASLLANRQVQMTVRPSAPTTTATTARPTKRKAIEPERIPPDRAASSSRILVGATPQRRLGHILAPDTPNGMDVDDEETVPDTPVGL